MMEFGQHHMNYKCLIKLVSLVGMAALNLSCFPLQTIKKN